MNKAIIKGFIIIVLFFILYLIGKKTYSSLYSIINGNTDIDLADFSVKLNGVDITNSYDLTISDIAFTNSHASSNVVSPGSIGQFNLSLDTSNTDVAVLYTLSFDDATSNNNKLLTIKSVSIDGLSVQLVNNEYSKIIPLNEINQIKSIIVTVEWISNDLIDNQDLTSKELISLKLNVKQYNG
ncbi:MAG: hypothetical protein PHN42_06195 [Bacilli bacterium]|nr:hypothetical protein [Bacilli bacterium]